ncbi:hypothetical protein DWG18_06845 [Lysobacter sp. TY2-98]|uniref:DUF6161 domain-containing protein n=1 Tax=Lysobacter sp. TY2-98 TaxID=2290922 RepID=UPI000E201D5F|nr:DUF6161 domain-containing protein [Lysobacter sp. TY2-98]AXK72025.1 hypothetical protein DWG18_06845 [Lysobacter sp. TY2-98]
MNRFPEPISARVYGTSRVLTFQTAEDVIAWADKERSVWQSFPVEGLTSAILRAYWDEQRSYADVLRSQASQYLTLSDEERGNTVGGGIRHQIAANLGLVEQGIRLTADLPALPAVERLWPQAPDVAALIVVAGRTDAANILGNFGPNLTFASLGRAFELFAEGQPAEDPKWLRAQREEIAQVVSTLEALRSGLEASREAGSAAVVAMQRKNAENLEAHDEAATKLLNGIEAQWAKLNRVYDEQLAMAAPTQYWSKRASRHATGAAIAGVAFAALVVGSLTAFFVYAMPHLGLISLQKNTSVVLALVPVVVPAFGLIWIAKVVARLLSENLSLMRDAKERETMVKTFLAFMHDEERGEALLTDQDRILILHALFRPSSIASVDDSPPVHWFDILANKVADRK